MSSESIDTIKRRMIRNASKIWGYKDVQDINSFDPVLNLIFGALAYEIHGISNQINRVEERIIEKLLELLFAQNIYSHFPAHAIAYAIPLQPELTINESYQFHYKKKIQNPDNKEVKNNKNIFFTPISNVKLFNGAPKFLLSGSSLYKIDNQSKELVAELKQQDAVSYESLFIGLQMDQGINILDGLSLFFSLKSMRSSDLFYQQLHSANWKLNGEIVDFDTGFLFDKSTDNLLDQDFVQEESKTASKVSDKIIGLYEKSFLTLSKGNYSYQDFIKNHYCPTNEHVFDGYSDIELKDLIWLEIGTSYPISSELINDLSVSLNCFPVINRELNDFTFSALKGINVIPLYTNDLFFDIKKVSDTRNRIYVSSDSVSDERDETPSFVIRQGGIARFDSRNAHEMINDLINSIRDEAAGFSIIGGDLVSHELKQIDQILSRLKQRLDSKSVSSDQNTYLLVDSDVYHEKISVKYWSTAGEMANNIRSGSKLTVNQRYDIDEKSAKLLSHTHGGRQKLSKENKLNLLRKELLTKGSISTKGDIKALCIQLFSNQIQQVEIKKGAFADVSVLKGYNRSLDIYLSLTNKPGLSPAEKKYKVDELLISLSERSMNLLPYRIFVDGKLEGQSLK